MPDRLPPHWGHEPEDGRGLDASLSVEEILTDESLLAGQPAGISDSQRPVAGAMFALRAAPAGSELAGEAAARAAFRALTQPARPVPPVPVPVPAAYGADWGWGDPGVAEIQHTRVLPVPAAGQGPRPPARHRHRKRAGTRRGNWQVIALVGSAAAVVAIGTAALAGTFSGSAGPREQSASSTAAQTAASPGASAAASPRLYGTARPTADAAHSAPPKASATPGATPSRTAGPDPGELCREYFGFTRPAGKATPTEIFHTLSQLAGTDSRMGVIEYCGEQFDPQLFTRPPKPTSSSGKWKWFPGPGGSPGSEGASSGPDTGSGAGQGGLGQASSGRGGSDSGGSGTGSGGSQ